MAKRLSTPLLILLAICLLAVVFHFVLDEMGISVVSEASESTHHDNEFILPGTGLPPATWFVTPIPITSKLHFESLTLRPVFPPPNLHSLA
jgi:hypothetical protein